MRITKRVVDAAKPVDGKRHIVWSDQPVGFGLLVLPTGVRSYIFDYRTPEGRKRRITIGKVGTLTPEQAGKRAEELATQVKSGLDPLEAKAEARTAPTVADVIAAYLESAAFAAKAESTQAIDRGRIARHLLPLLGKKYAHKLSADDVQHAFNQIAAGKTATVEKTEKARGLARVTGGHGTARASIRLLRSVINWAGQNLGLKIVNPAGDLKLGKDGTRDVILDSAEQYESLFRTLARMEDEKRIRGPVADTIRLIALTGARRGEIRDLKWKHIDLKGGRIVLPPHSHKTGHATGQARIIGLTALAQEIIARQPAGGPDEYVFRPAKGEGPLNVNTPWRAVRVEAGLPEGIALHGLRHSVASMMAMNGAGASEIQAITGHRDLSMVMRYVHFAENARASLAERAAAPAAAGMAAAAGKPAAPVVPIKGGGR